MCIRDSDEPAVYCSLDTFPKFNTVEEMLQFDKSMGVYFLYGTAALWSGVDCIFHCLYLFSTVSDAVFYG